jgi:hypothetical protein
MQAAPSPRGGLAGYGHREEKERGASRLSNRPDGAAREGAGLGEPDARPGDQPRPDGILEMSRGRFPGFVATAGAALELRPTVV